MLFRVGWNNYPGTIVFMSFRGIQHLVFELCKSMTQQR